MEPKAEQEKKRILELLELADAKAIHDILRFIAGRIARQKD